MLLTDTVVKAWTIDRDLQPMEALCAHSPEYFGEVVAQVLGGTFTCVLPQLSKELNLSSPLTYLLRRIPQC